VPADLECTGLRKSYGAVEALRGVSLRVEPGRFFAIVGPSGCGKSTLLRIVGGHEAQDAGEVFLRGVDHSRTPPERRPVHTVFQGHALFPHLSVRDNVAFPLRMAGVPRAERRRRAEEALSLVRLPGRGDRAVSALSGGERQRVALARSILPRPAVLLLDEPLASLDLPLRRAMQDELRALRRETGITFVHVTHDQEEAFRLADAVAVLRAGRVVQEGDPREVYRRPASPFVASFLGVANLLPGTADGAGGFRTRGGLRVRAGSAPRGDAVAAFREERVRVAPAEAGERRATSGAATAEGTFEGPVVDVAFLGPHARVVLAAEPGGERVAGLAPAGSPLAVGARARAEVSPDDVFLLPEEPA
jgi:ABC-type Fe3+/spermidine/putrescine transport system ATPase subunit